MRIFNTYITNGIAQRVLFSSENYGSKDETLLNYRNIILDSFPNEDFTLHHTYGIPTESSSNKVWTTFVCPTEIEWYKGDLADKVLYLKTYYDFDRKEKSYELIWRGNHLDAGLPMPEGVYAIWVGQKYDKDYKETDWVVYYQSRDSELLARFVESLGCKFPISKKEIRKDDIYRVVFNKETMQVKDTSLLGHVQEKMNWTKEGQKVCFYGWWTEHISNIDETPLEDFKYNEKGYPIENQIMEKTYKLVETSPGTFKRELV